MTERILHSLQSQINVDPSNIFSDNVRAVIDVTCATCLKRLSRRKENSFLIFLLYLGVGRGNRISNCQTARACKAL